MSNLLELKPPETGNAENYDGIERISELSYSEFFWRYMKPNRPVVITSIGKQWLCSKEWIGANGIDLRLLATKIGESCTVPVANCSKTYFNSHEKSELSFSEYLKYWNNRIEDQHDILYLKDWHLKALNPGYNFYTVPKYFASDWLNEFLLDTHKDDYRFVYIGPKNSWTPFHSDVFSSFSWSTNICGRKKWLILPPGEETKLRNSLGNDPFSITEDSLTAKNVRYFTIDQKEYESIFVPSGWYHQVLNMTDTISVNHNWFNGCNIDAIWKSLRQNLHKVIAEIDDCNDMENFREHCQIMLKALFGMNYIEFFEILEHIARKRMIERRIISFDLFELNEYHKKFDLKAISEVLEKIVKDEQCDIVDRCDRLLNEMRDYKKIKP